MSELALQRPSGVAVDFGGTKIAATRVKVGQTGKIVQARTDGGADIATQIDAICNLLAELELLADERVGVALAGRVDRRGEWFALNTEELCPKVGDAVIRRHVFPA